MKNLIYFGYYLKITNWGRLWFDMNYVAKKYGKSKFKMCVELLYLSLKNGSSFNEYFYYEFWHKSNEDINKYATMGFMYAYQKRNNPLKTRVILSDKIKFFEEYSDFIGRKWLKIFEVDDTTIEEFIMGKDKVVLKGSTGGGGKNVKIVDLVNLSVLEIKAIAREYNYNIMEEYVYQHESLRLLAPNSLNTIRVITQYTNGNVEIIGTILRMGIDKNTDNLSSGGLACNVDIQTGIINTEGVSFDITKIDSPWHPLSGIEFVGFQIPMWDQVKSICDRVAKYHPENKSVGWDIAITNDGPIVIEGNHDWGARLWQMPLGCGQKYKLAKYL